MTPARAAVLTGGLMTLTALAACGPVPVDQAERSCLDDARMATGPRTNILLGVGTGGRHTGGFGGVSVAVSGDYLAGRDPAQAFDRCVMRRSGQMPVVPLQQQPGWRG